MKKISLLAFVLTICLLAGKTVLAQGGTWTALTNPNPAGGVGVMLLLTDGTILTQGPGCTNVWTKLTPDSTGNYVNGTWTTVAAMGTQRLYFGSVVLPSGKVFVLGGEYSGINGNQTLTPTGEMYDPVKNTWTPTASFPLGNFGDDPALLLNTGKVLCGYPFGPQTYLYDPTLNTFTATGTKLLNDQSDEETWMQLPNGNILCYNIFASPATGNGSSQQYNPSTGKWTSAGAVPVILTGSSFGYELGPGTRLPDGRYLLVGANNNTAIYTPSTSTWVAGPTLPAKMGSDDAPGAMLPNGMFIFAVDTSIPLFTAPTQLYEFDYTANAVTNITPTGNLNGLLNNPAFIFRMLILPNGHMLFGGDGSATVWDFAPTGTAQTSWQPVITSITSTATSTYTLSGTQLTGISEGASYGDDAGMSTNYPIVRLQNTATSKIYYAKTTNWTPGVATGSAVTSVQFVTPTGIPNGTYNVTVVANGISSAAKTLGIGVATASGSVTASFTAANNSLVLQGDANSNSLTLTYTPTTSTAGILKVEGANGTSIVANGTTTKLPSLSYNLTGPLTLNADMGAGDDSIACVEVVGSTLIITLDAGNDNAAFTLCKITTLNVNGGTGTGEKNTLLITSSSITNLVKTGF